MDWISRAEWNREGYELVMVSSSNLDRLYCVCVFSTDLLEVNLEQISKQNKYVGQHYWFWNEFLRENVFLLDFWIYFVFNQWRFLPSAQSEDRIRWSDLSYPNQGIGQTNGKRWIVWNFFQNREWKILQRVFQTNKWMFVVDSVWANCQLARMAAMRATQT